MSNTATLPTEEIRATDTYSGVEGSFSAGKTYFVDPKRANFLIGKGLAMAVPQKSAEPAPAPATPAASATPATPATSQARRKPRES